MGLAETAELAVRISLKDNASAGIRGLQRNIGGLSASLGRVGKGFGQIGAGVARAGLLVGGAAVTGLAAVAKAAIDFEDAFAGVRKTVNQADLEAAGLSFESLAQSFRNMATEIPIAATEFAAIGETAGALGIKAKDITEFTKTVALLGVTTNLSTDAAAEALGKLGTILNLTGDDFTEFADTLVNLGNQGASTESEIIEVAKRFAAMGKQAGLTTDQILALSSAASSLGIEPEAAGSALSRIFGNMATEIANGTSKGKEFAKVTGDSLDELRRRINKGDALGILQETLKGISGMSRTQAASVLKALGITNVRDRNAILLMAQNLGFVNDQLGIAEQSAGAMGREAEKRFATVASKLKLVKQNVIEAAITMGSEFAPAIGRVADKAIAFLKDPSTKNELRNLGKDIGQFIDSIDWSKVKDGAIAFKDALKGAAEFAMTLLSILDKLPNEIKGATLGLLALNKLSGGLVGAGLGNVVGGLSGAAATGLASRAPGVGRLFAQPVFVTNWPMGGLGGVGGAAGAAAGRGAGLLSVVSKVFVVGAAAEFASMLAGPINQLGKDIGAGFRPQEFESFGAAWERWRAGADWPFGQKNAPGWAGGGSSFTDTTKAFPTSGMSPDERQEANDTQAKLDAVRGKIESTNAATVTRLGFVQQTTARGSDAIVRAIRGIQRPIVNVNVSQSYARITYSTGTTLSRSGKLIPTS